MVFHDELVLDIRPDFCLRIMALCIQIYLKIFFKHAV
jgi:hypothetical protein